MAKIHKEYALRVNQSRTEDERCDAELLRENVLKPLRDEVDRLSDRVECSRTCKITRNRFGQEIYNEVVDRKAVSAYKKARLKLWMEDERFRQALCGGSMTDRARKVREENKDYA